MSVLRAAALAGALSGVPSTAHALVHGGDPLAATWAAGRLVAPGAEPGATLFGAAALAHGTLSLGWTLALSRCLRQRPRTQRTVLGALAGAGIAVLDLGAAHVLKAHPRFGPIAALQVGPQVADHVAFGALVGWVGVDA